jgi:hypothetical protein
MARWASILAVAAAALVLASPAAARTFSGSVTVLSVGTAASTYDAVTATAVVSLSQVCDPVPDSPAYEDCGYTPAVTTTTADQACGPGAPSWAGPSFASGDGPGDKVLAATWTEVPALGSGQRRACLYASDVLVADVVYDVPAAPSPVAAIAPAPARPKPTAAAGPLPISFTRLGVSRARTELVEILETEFAGFVRRGLHRDCYRLTVAVVRCRVWWDLRRRWRYHGAVDMRLDPRSPESVAWTHTVRRKRLRAAGVH